MTDREKKIYFVKMELETLTSQKLTKIKKHNKEIEEMTHNIQKLRCQMELDGVSPKYKWDGVRRPTGCQKLKNGTK